MPFVYGLFFLNSTIPSTMFIANEMFTAVQQMINALHVMISVLMSPRHHDIDLIDTHIKVFLSCCDRYKRVSTGNSSSEIPRWAKKGNFVSLLNLCDQIEFYGSVRLYWEGSRERFIQVVKAIRDGAGTTRQEDMWRRATTVYKFTNGRREESYSRQQR